MPLSSELQAQYDEIKANLPELRTVYQDFLREVGTETQSEWVQSMAALGLNLDVKSGHISYNDDFKSKKPNVPFNLTYIRHGKTTGNTEPRVYQGYVDEPDNQLNAIGKQQALDAADTVARESKYVPDIIVFSPLGRAKETGQAYVDKMEFQSIVEVIDVTHEQMFGDWDGKRVIDIPKNNIAHLFYLEQNVCVKSFSPYVLKSEDGKVLRTFSAENFVEALLRGVKILDTLSKHPVVQQKAKEGKVASIFMYGHSMIGAALNMLCGKGQEVTEADENGVEVSLGYLGFDSKYTMPNGVPFVMNEAPASQASQL